MTINAQAFKLLTPTQQAALVRSDGVRYVRVFGFNDDIDTTTDPEDLWNVGGTFTGHPASTQAAETVDLVSTSASDALFGTGANTVAVEGLDSDFNEVTENEVMNGITTVTTTQEFLRVNKATVVVAGTGQTAAGRITLNHTTTTANVFGDIEAGTAVTMNAAYTVPAGYTALIIGIHARVAHAAGSLTAAIFSVKAKDGSYASAAYEEVAKVAGATGTDGIVQLQGGIAINEKHDILVTVDEVSADNTHVSADLEILLVKNAAI